MEWTWKDGGRLVDKEGRDVAWGDAHGAVVPLGPLQSELIRLAPEMEATLRDLEWSGTYASDAGYSCCPDCSADAAPRDGKPRAHEAYCELAAILAALDAARLK